MANIVNYLERIINGIKTNTFLQIGTLILIFLTLLWNIIYSPDEREDQEMMVKEMVGLVEVKRTFEKEFNDLAYSDEDYKNLQNEFRLFSCKIEQYKSSTENIAVFDNCPDNKLLPRCDNQIVSSCFGEIALEDDELYFGEIINNEPNGDGVFTDKYGQSYWGKYKDGDQYGNGYITDNNMRVIYRGEFADSLRNGQGESFTYEPKTYYKGSFLNDKEHGEGLYVETELLYEGSFKSGVFYGYGSSFTKNGIEYDGMFEDGAFHGRGVWKEPGYGVYKGDFKFGLSEGTGTLVYDNGDVYEGSWYRDNFHGYGKYTYSGGESHSGIYHYQLLNDENAEITRGDQTCRGGYSNDRYHGYVHCIHKNGTYSKNNYNNGLLSGESEWSETNGIVYFRTYKDSLENGPAKDVFPDNTIHEYTYVMGKIVGKRIETKNNVLLSVCDYDNQVLENCTDSE